MALTELTARNTKPSDKPVKLTDGNGMMKFDNYSKIFAQLLYHSSSHELLNDKGKTNIDERSGNRKAIERLEKEMAQVHYIHKR